MEGQIKVVNETPQNAYHQTQKKSL